MEDGGHIMIVYIGSRIVYFIEGKKLICLRLHEFYFISVVNFDPPIVRVEALFEAILCSFLQLSHHFGELNFPLNIILLDDGSN